MVSVILIFMRGGLVLWTCKELGNALKGSPIDSLIWSCLLEEGFGASSYNYDAAGAAYTLKWTFHSELGLREFLEMYDSKQTAYTEDCAEDLKKLKQVVGNPLNNSKKQGQMQNARFEGVSNKKSESHNLENGHSNCNYVHNEYSKKMGASNGAFDVNKLQKIRAKGGKKAAKKQYRSCESIMDKEAIFSSESKAEEDEEEGKDSKPENKRKGWFSAMFQSFVGKANLEKSDLEPALKVLKDRLMMKNVAEEIVEKLRESVAASLKGKKLALFTRISSTVQVSMEEALVRILTPRCSIDILRDVHAGREQRKPYVVVLVGVNGVGKSTNLAKVAYWLLQHEMNVMMATCDTFRYEAVEQLWTHARRFQIPTFEKGYEKDPAIVAKEAIQEATDNGSDVVLVDTADRMQDNEPLMRALSKLIYLSNPVLVFFVGNDAVDELSKFNQKLADLLTSTSPRLIDGILLTKFDTIDDKVVTLQTARSLRVLIA
ncbi:hypothetical protein I3843_05G131800 [Carya illinoinensis]|nr:hypothetical protein I3843_05G131800 [Carya illinoinensis]